MEGLGGLGRRIRVGEGRYGEMMKGGLGFELSLLEGALAYLRHGFYDGHV